ncbi:MAG: hypothetical protein HYY17_16750 [Planctomycetes bacterium]|nr:hypothetical protein [Planctomycetota bacterium]
MADNGSGDARRRLELLEKAYLEDRERWRANDERWRANDERFNRMMEANRKEHEEFQADFRETMRAIVEQIRRLDRLEKSNEASLRILRRMMER